MKVAIIGANGQLGSDICDVFKKKHKVIALMHKQVDITDFKKLRSRLKKINPDLIINTAAYHKVDEIESHYEKAFKVNAFAQYNLCKIANEIDSFIVYISTDYVFGQDEKRKEYKETDKTAPVNLYGISKVAGEHFTTSTAGKYYVVRTSGLFGINQSRDKGDNFVERMIKLSRSNSNFSVVNDQVLSPTYTRNLAKNLMTLVNTKKFGIYHMVSQGHCSWWEFTQEIQKILNLDSECRPVSSDFFKTEAKRPKFSALSNSNLNKLGINEMESWKINLRNYLVEKGHLSRL